MLKRHLAPITEDVWDEIDQRAKEVFGTYLSARKAIKVNGPKGWDYTVVPEGRLELIEKDKDGLCYGAYKVKPLVETRIEFELDRWELDNEIRGAKDLELKPLEEAVKKAALFEEGAVYNGLSTAGVTGLNEVGKAQAIPVGKSGEEIIDAISQGVLSLQEAFAGKPYVLIAGEEVWKRLNKETQGYPIIKRIEESLGTKVVYSHAVEGALLLPYNHEDLELTIGQDFTIGYQAHDNEKVRFFIAESFTFRILDPDIIVKLTL